MAGARRSGKRVSLLSSIRRFEADVEADFARFYPAIDYRDRFRPGGGPSGLTIRRLLVLVSRLPAESSFQAARENRIPWSIGDSAVLDVWESLMGKRHPARVPLSERERLAVERAERPRLVAERRRRARAHNERFLARRRARLAK